MSILYKYRSHEGPSPRALLGERFGSGWLEVHLVVSVWGGVGRRGGRIRILRMLLGRHKRIAGRPYLPPLVETVFLLTLPWGYSTKADCVSPCLPSVVAGLLELMTFTKLNVLHWHITDDQSWPLYIAAYPLLSGLSAFYQPAMMTLRLAAAVAVPVIAVVHQELFFRLLGLTFLRL